MIIKRQGMNPKFNKAAATLHPIRVKAQVAQICNQVRRNNVNVLIRVSLAEETISRWGGGGPSQVDVARKKVGAMPWPS